MAAIGIQVESLCFDVGHVERLPLEVLFGQLGEGGIPGILSHGLDGLGTILGFLGSGDVGQPRDM